MTLPRLWMFLAIALPTLAAIIAGMSSVDLAYQLRAGAQILGGGGIPSVDTWTFTAAGQPWFDQQWGAQAALDAVYRIAGWTGLVVFRAGLVAVIFGCLFEIGRRAGLGLRQAAWLTLAAFIVSAPALGLRPQLLGMALFAAILLLVADRRAAPRRLWIVPVLVVVWANVHGSFFLGPLVLLLAWLEDVHDRSADARRTLLVTIVTIVAACLTPFGPAVWAYAVGLSTNPRVTALITEWQPTSLRDIAGILFFASALGVAALIARRGRVVPWPTLLWLAVFLGIGIYAVRGIAWWSLAVVPVVATMLARVSAADADVAGGASEAAPTRVRDTSLSRRLNVGVAGIIVVAAVALLPVWRPVDPATGAPDGLLTDAPPGITAALRDMARPGDRVFAPQPWGSWIEFALPDLPVAIDSRIELFPAGVWIDYGTVIAGSEGWQPILDRWDVSVIVVEPDRADFLARLVTAGWHPAYSGPDGVVLGRDGT
jgi:hypothetical protein